MKRTALSILIVSIIASCSPQLSPDQGWENQRWVVTEMKGAPARLSSAGKEAYIQFSPQEKRFTGNAGCNRISGNYTLDKKDRIHFGEVISTKMSCEDIGFETGFLSSLAGIDGYETSGNILMLRQGDNVLLKLESRPAN